MAFGEFSGKSADKRQINDHFCHFVRKSRDFVVMCRTKSFTPSNSSAMFGLNRRCRHLHGSLSKFQSRPKPTTVVPRRAVCITFVQRAVPFKATKVSVCVCPKAPVGFRDMKQS